MSREAARAAAEDLIAALGLNDLERRKRGPFLGIGLTTDDDGEWGLALHLRNERQAELAPIRKAMAELGSRHVDVRVSGTPRMLLLQAAQWSPSRPSKVLEPGDPVLRPIGALGGDIGTLGAFVKVKANGVRFLSCNHVLAAVNRGHPGDTIWWGALRASTLSYWDVGQLDQAPPITNGGSLDVALAEPHPDGVPLSFPIPGIGPVTASRSSFDDVLPKLAVEKVGYATGRTLGKVHASPLLLYAMDYGAQGTFWFTNIISVIDGKFSDEGDSGSLVVTRKGGRVEAVGVLFAGDADTSYVSPIWDVLGALGARIC